MFQFYLHHRGLRPPVLSIALAYIGHHVGMSLFGFIFGKCKIMPCRHQTKMHEIDFSRGFARLRLTPALVVRTAQLRFQPRCAGPLGRRGCLGGIYVVEHPYSYAVHILETLGCHIASWKGCLIIKPQGLIIVLALRSAWYVRHMFEWQIVASNRHLIINPQCSIISVWPEDPYVCKIYVPDPRVADRCLKSVSHNETAASRNCLGMKIRMMCETWMWMVLLLWLL